MVISDLVLYYWYTVPFPEGGFSAAAKHKEARCKTDDKVFFFLIHAGQW